MVQQQQQSKAFIPMENATCTNKWVTKRMTEGAKSQKSPHPIYRFTTPVHGCLLSSQPWPPRASSASPRLASSSPRVASRCASPPSRRLSTHLVAFISPCVALQRASPIVDASYHLPVVAPHAITTASCRRLAVAPRADRRCTISSLPPLDEAWLCFMN